jgi:hypothetical protein
MSTATVGTSKVLYSRGKSAGRELSEQLNQRWLTMDHTQLFREGDIVTPSLAVSNSASSNIFSQDIHREKGEKRNADFA